MKADKSSRTVTPKASQDLLQQLQQAAEGTLRIISNEPLDSETQLLRITMPNTSMIAITHKSQLVEDPLTLPIDGNGVLNSYTQRLLSVMLQIHTGRPNMSVSKLHDKALIAMRVGSFIMRHTTITDIGS